jgi:hypothetical protein
MKPQNRTLYRATFTLPYCCLLGLRFAPCYLYHFAMRPYQQALPAIGYYRSHVGLRRRRRDATPGVRGDLYDTYVTAPIQAQQARLFAMYALAHILIRGLNAAA